MMMEIKSRMLLPRPSAEAAEEEDPRAELVRRLQDLRGKVSGRACQRRPDELHGGCD